MVMVMKNGYGYEEWLWLWRMVMKNCYGYEEWLLLWRMVMVMNSQNKGGSYLLKIYIILQLINLTYVNIKFEWSFSLTIWVKSSLK